VSRDFLLWFFHRTTSPSPIRQPRKDFQFFRIFGELFVRIFNRLPGVVITRESITNTNISTRIRKNSKLFPDVPIWTRRSCLMKKTGVKKSRDTAWHCSFNTVIWGTVQSLSCSWTLHCWFIKSSIHRYHLTELSDAVKSNYAPGGGCTVLLLMAGDDAVSSAQ
jgi:hypothetical protein